MSHLLKKCKLTLQSNIFYLNNPIINIIIFNNTLLSASMQKVTKEIKAVKRSWLKPPLQAKIIKLARTHSLKQ